MNSGEAIIKPERVVETCSPSSKKCVTLCKLPLKVMMHYIARIREKSINISVYNKWKRVNISDF